MDYNKTLNLPKTDFPMRASLPEREPEVQKFWEENELYQKVQDKTKGNKKFILHDGPPYANGNIHLGHTLNKVLKDIIVKYKSMQGFDSPYVPGWDTHGLPIEQQAIKALGLNRHAVGPVAFRQKCKEYALKYVNIQREQFKRLGVRADWEKPYITLEPEFEAKQIEVFGEMAKKGYIYKGLKPVYWCATCETALAEAEIEYADKESHSIYVKFAVEDGKGVLDELENPFVVIWTTTPWTLPANVAISVNPDFEYAAIKVGNETLVVASELVESVAKAVGIENYEIVKTFAGSSLERVICKHPFIDRKSLVILGDHVTLEQGTGCVHTAPGHGVEDFMVGRKYNLEVISPVDNKGYFTEEAGMFATKFYKDTNEEIINHLKETGYLLNSGKISHQYPHCWRCKHPILFRATEQWFASINGFREDALKAIKEVKWIPAWGEDRITNMVADRQDWCISRQRVWGVPIPIFYCEECNHPLINDETINTVKELFRREGSDAWFAKTAAELLPAGTVCPECKHNSFRKETDIMDVWFDSGSSHAAVLEEREELAWPADLYLEGSDQHRGWFQSSLLTAVSTRGTAPYKTVLTHGFLVDEAGRKMSKSLGNVIDPLKIIKEMGADILRLWVSSADYRNDVAESPGIMKQMSETYRKIRNTSRFILSNLYDFEPENDNVGYAELQEIDQWAVMRLHQLIEKVTSAYDNYEFHVVYHAIHNFCTVDMSAFYLDILKDRLYTSPAKSKARRAAQTVLYDIIQTIVKLLAPVLSFTAEEIWRYIPAKGEKEMSVQLTEWPKANEAYANTKLEDAWQKLIKLRGFVARVSELARKEKVIGHSLEAKVKLYATGEWVELLAKYRSLLSEIFIVSQVEVFDTEDANGQATTFEELQGVSIAVEKAVGEKCERCWVYSETTGKDTEHPTICKRCADVVKSL